MSLDIEKNVPLSPHTTLGIGGKAEIFADATSKEELVALVEHARSEHLPVTVIGGGSNVLVSDRGVQGLVVRMAIPGIEYEECDEFVRAHVGAGVVFDEFVLDTVYKGLWGLENLSGIPGTVGGVPIQNVGAYGVEVKHVIESVDVFDTMRQEFQTLTNEECAFAYRDSIFKHEGKDRYIVVGVTFRLTRTRCPNLVYKDLAKQFGEDTVPSLASIRDAVIGIRREKFPDWTNLGTAGSFFKNPIISAVHAHALRARYDGIPLYEEADGRYKVALGWILDHVLHMKGYREGHVGLYEKQALVLVNHGSATSDEVLAFSDMVIKKIFDTCELTVEREAVVIV
jgi:UDP-N-acetylmuramate dehydrogenase